MRAPQSHSDTGSLATTSESAGWLADLNPVPIYAPAPHTATSKPAAALDSSRQAVSEAGADDRSTQLDVVELTIALAT
jgi:hypothetical protein